jgi:DNA polymerase zeta
VLLLLRHKCLDAAYYLDRVLIPPLERIFNLVGADVRAWYEDMPKSVRSDVSDSTSLSPRKKHLERLAANRLNIEEHFYRTQCVLCGAHAESGGGSLVQP